ncbi:MAG TPA: EscU/YscU/HrcU family type III secretion system export apparatus switch protein [Chloroflexota bacterium]|nr:EscU/YscU/HrcU family type III secretion system export apparatus switch protein [Chloroflexota bacterium]
MDENRARQLRRAVALRYDRARGVAPTVAATGSGYVADRIIEIAREHGVPIREDPDLVQLLAKLDLEQTIPPELYAVVAEVFAFVYRLNTEHGRAV